jgi:EmrB/QacA subfamily drug resistance transporter
MMTPQTMAVITRIFAPDRRGAAMGIWGATAGVATLVGPILGGVLVDGLGWEWIFFINIPVGIIAVSLAWKLLPVGKAEAAGKLDVPGLVLLATGLPALTYGLAKAGSGAGFGSAQALVPIVIGLVLTGVFVFHSLRSQNPLLNVRLYANRAFAAASATTFFLGASLFGAMILLPLYFQIVRGDSVVRTGVLLIPQSLGAAFAMPIAGRMADRYGGGPIALIGVIVAAVSTLPLAFVTPGTPLWEIEASLFARGLGIGLAMMPAMSAAYAVLRPEEIADATPQLTVVQRVGGSIGTAVLAVVLGTALTGAAGPAATSAAFASAYWWAFGLSVVAVIPALILLQAERRTRKFRSEERSQAATEAALEAA